MLEENAILYVEDSRVAQRMLARVMEPVGSFQAADDLASARAMLAEQVFDLVVLDYELPDGQGLELAETLRADPRYENKPIILFCAGLDNNLAYQAMQAGVNESFAKPMNMLELREHLVRHMDTPTFKRVQRELLNLVTIAWKAEGRHHEFTPDLNIHLVGQDPDAVRARMQEVLEREVLAKPDPEQYPADVHTVKHVIALACQKESDGPATPSEQAA